MAKNITLMGADYPQVPAVQLPQTGGGTAAFYDVSGTTVTPADVAAGVTFIDANGVRQTGVGKMIKTLDFSGKTNTTGSINTGLSSDKQAITAVADDGTNVSGGVVWKGSNGNTWSAQFFDANANGNTLWNKVDVSGTIYYID